MSWVRRAGGWLVQPLVEAYLGLERCLARSAWALAAVAGGMLAGWWIYVPVHELLHAAGCWLAGGEVRRLEIGAVYGGGLLARALPFVAPGGEYAGRLSGFDTHGSDWIYLATDLAPYLLTVFPGVWWLRRAARGRRPRAWFFGAALPVALAPFLSATGDAYEIGSILVTRLPPWAAPAARELLRGDDLGARWTLLAAAAAAAARAAGAPAWWWPAAWPAPFPHLAWGLALAALAGLAWARLTYAAGSVVARWARQPVLRFAAPARAAPPVPNQPPPEAPTPSPAEAATSAPAQAPIATQGPIAAQAPAATQSPAATPPAEPPRGGGAATG